MNDLTMTQQEIEEFTVANTMYFARKWQKYPESSLFSGWNWVAFFLTFYWAMYRKMYALGAVVIVYAVTVQTAMLFSLWHGILTTGSLPDIFLMGLVTIAPCAFMGALGTGLYRKKAVGALSQTADMDTEQKKEYLNKKGGVNISAALICLAIVVTSNIIISNAIQNTSFLETLFPGKSIVSDCGRFSATIPAGWVAQSGHVLNDDSNLEALNIKDEAYFMMLTDVKSDLDYGFDEWANEVFGYFISSMPNADISEPFYVVIDGKPAVWLTVAEQIDDYDCMFLLIFIEGYYHFAQVCCWCQQDDYNRLETAFVEIVNSIQGL